MIYVDMDGVVADFDEQYFRLAGKRATRWPERESVDWDLVRSVPGFYRAIPPMPDMRHLIRGLMALGVNDFTMLTGVPNEVNAADNEKVDWVRAHIDPIAGRVVPVICTRSRDKCLYAKTGDLLIDDYLKYRHLWERVGGVFVYHTSALHSLRQVEANILTRQRQDAAVADWRKQMEQFR